MIVTSVPFAFAADYGMPLVIDVSSEERYWTDLGTEGRHNYYDEDGYVFTGMYDEMGIHFTIGGLFFSIVSF